MCANHYVQPAMKIDFKSEKEPKILTWIAMDFSEGSGTMESFSCRFQTPEIAGNFKVPYQLSIYKSVRLCG